VNSINNDIEVKENPPATLKLRNIIGRRAMDRRNNVKVDKQGRVMYNAGSMMVFMKREEDPEAVCEWA